MYLGAFVQQVAVEEESVPGIHLHVDEVEATEGLLQPLGIGAGLFGREITFEVLSSLLHKQRERRRIGPTTHT